ncbi:MAG: aldehyde ferredoxin oxidoreductase N-terminal domain-containing protein, partial [Eubacteriales bacterium]|nr:aldehyde ferredoxin oxidoreductase N-terminal domain-containing protein [Eubacteriales bacterium]
MSKNGKMLKINLTDQKTDVMTISDEWYADYIGGEGFAAKVLYDHLEAGLDPFSEKNMLVFATGPLTGTKAPCSGRLCIGYKSPLTGTIGMTNVGGHLAPMIKRAGYEMIIVDGKSEKPVYISINDDQVTFKDATNLWGLDTEETEDKIREEFGNDKVRIAEIGPAGENLVRFSAIMVDKHRAAGRGGAGAVMGSKNLKAIACFGSGQLKVDDIDSMSDFAAKARQELNDEAFVREELKPFGTPSFMDSINALGLLPTKNWQYTTFDAMDTLGHAAYHEKLNVKAWACFGCPIACGRHTEIKDGEYKGESGGGPEYETLGALGSKCYVKDLNAIAMGNYICNRMGLDTISTGQVIATAMEWYEKGLIDEKT